MLESPKRMATEGLPVAAVLLFWNLLAFVPGLQGVGGPVRNAGVLMAGLYVLIRGVSLSSHVLPTTTGNLRGVLYENARVAVPAGPWFVAAMAVFAFDGHTYAYGPSWAAAALGGALAGGGLGVVALYAVAAGYRTLGGGTAAGGPPPADLGGVGGFGGASDDETATDDASADD